MQGSAERPDARLWRAYRDGSGEASTASSPGWNPLYGSKRQLRTQYRVEG